MLPLIWAAQVVLWASRGPKLLALYLMLEGGINLKERGLLPYGGFQRIRAIEAPPAPHPGTMQIMAVPDEDALRAKYQAKLAATQGLAHPLAPLAIAFLELKTTSKNTITATEEMGDLHYMGPRVVAHAPRAFQRIRRNFGMDESAWEEMLMDSALFETMRRAHCIFRGSSNSKGSGRRGTQFFSSPCGTYVIKEQTAEENRAMLDFLPHYEGHVKQYPRSLLARHCGLFSIVDKNAEALSDDPPPELAPSTRHFLVLQNVFAAEGMPLHPSNSLARPPSPLFVFDVKGSTSGRFSLPLDDWGAYRTLRSREWMRTIVAKAPDLPPRRLVQLKDQDWLAVGLPRARGPKQMAALDQVEADTAFLAKHQIMDYSLLVGVHFKRDKRVEDRDAPLVNVKDEQPEEAAEEAEVQVVGEKDEEQRRFPQLPQLPQLPPLPPRLVELKAKAGDMLLEGKRLAQQVLPLPAGAEEPDAPTVDLLPERPPHGHAAAWYLPNAVPTPELGGDVEGYSIAIIDFLQAYGIKKRLETAGKVTYGLKFHEISAVPPDSYKDRFLFFLRNAVF